MVTWEKHEGNRKGKWREMLALQVHQGGVSEGVVCKEAGGKERFMQHISSYMRRKHWKEAQTNVNGGTK